MGRLLPLTGLEAAALRGIRAREAALEERGRALDAEAAAVRADLGEVVRAIAGRLALDPAGCGAAYRLDAALGLAIIPGGEEARDGDGDP